MSGQYFVLLYRMWFKGTLPMILALSLMIGMRVNQVSASPQNAPPPGYCDDSKHDPTKWHPAVDPATGCMYGHEHGADPVPSGSLFAPLVFGGDEATNHENHHKHNGYKVFYIHRSNTSNANPTSDPCDDVRLRVHMDVTPFERTGQYHSFEAAIAHCANGQRDVTYIQGWADFGTTVRVSTREGGDPGIRPMKFAPSPNDFNANGLNIWEVWYGRSGVGLDMGWLMGEVPTVHHDGSDPNNPSSWHWTGGAGNKRKVENFNFYGWRETRRGEFWTDQYGRSVDPNSATCKDPNSTIKCLRQYVSPLFGKTRNDQIIFNLQYTNSYDARGVNFPSAFPATGGHLPWGVSQPAPATPTPTQPNNPQPSPTPTQPNNPPPTTIPTANPSEPTVRVDVTPATGSSGTAVQVVINVLNVVDLYGLQAQCTVDPKVLKGTQPAEGDVFTRSNSIGVDKGFNTTDGSWMIAGSRRRPNPAFSGSGVAFRLNYTVLGAGGSPVNCTIMGVSTNGTQTPLKVINGGFNSAPQIAQQPSVAQPAQPVQPPVEPTPVLLPTENLPYVEMPTMEATVQLPSETQAPVQSASINGVMNYQNRQDNSGISVQLRDAGLNVLAEVVTGENGAFSFTDVPVGAYSLKAIAPYHLDWVTTVTVDAAGQVVDLGTYTCVAGDTNDDGAVDLTDASLVGANFGIEAPLAPDGANLNGDAEVNVGDLALVGSNFEQTGPKANE